MDSIVEISGLGKSFAGQPAISDLTVQLPRGQLTGLVGPDGAGKTTLLRLMTGLLRPDAGTIRLEGRSVMELRKTQPAFFGYMPQKFGLYEDLTVQENLNLYAKLHDVTVTEQPKLFRQMLEFTDLTRFTDRLAGNLSGGMKQKLGLACSLLGKPKLLLLDEPGVGVDPISRRDLWEMVRSLMQGGMTVLWSTSYLDEAEKCDRVLLLNEAKLLFDGLPGQLTGRLDGRVYQVRRIAGDRRKLLGDLLNHPQIIDGVIQGSSLRLVAGAGAPPLTLQSLGIAAQAEALTRVPPRFEDAFIDLLGGGPGGNSALADQFQTIGGDDAAIVAAEQLTKRYGNFTAADRISFSIRRGRIFGLLGPNGAGKSTTFKMLCGLLKPTAGRASIDGADLARSGAAARRKLGYMAQKFSLYEGLNVLQNLKFFSGIYGLRGATQQTAIRRMVEVFHLNSYLKANAGELPLGIKQQLALACAVMHQPAVLFLDEPTSGVSPVTRRKFWTHINHLVEKGVTIMITTHFMDEAEYCDQISLIYRGRAIADGTPDELKQRITTPELPEPTLEDAFIALVKQFDREHPL